MKTPAFLRALIHLMAFAVFFNTAALAVTLEKPYDHSLWDQFLKTYVNDKGEVDYASVQAHPEPLYAYLDQISSLNVKDFISWPREERLALTLNLYHAGVIYQVIKHYPIKTIQEIPGVWDLPSVKIGKSVYSLNKVRDSLLIKEFRDEKINAALSSGARGFPVLRTEAFTGPKLEGQLYLAARAFVNDPVRNPIVAGKKRLQISRIFKWYAEDFKLDFGAPDEDGKFDVRENAVLGFLAYYLDDKSKIEYLETRNYKIKYPPFDWGLNDWRSTASSASSVA